MQQQAMEIKKCVGQREVTKAWVAEAKATAERGKEAEHILALQVKSNTNAIAAQVAARPLS
jgi:hypothetical protein